MKRSVLIVDDEALIRMVAVQIVIGAGYDAAEASSADDAISHLERYSDVATVLTDINMPGSMDGLQLSCLIRDRWPTIGLIVASGRAFANSLHIPWGVQLISKPYTSKSLTHALSICAA